MAVDRIQTLHHLTPRGWIEGSTDSMWTAHNRTVEPPSDRVETWKYKVYQSSAYSPEQRTWSRVWVSPNVTEEETKALHSRYPDPHTDE